MSCLISRRLLMLNVIIWCGAMPTSHRSFDNIIQNDFEIIFHQSRCHRYFIEHFVELTMVTLTICKWWMKWFSIRFNIPYNALIQCLVKCLSNLEQKNNEFTVMQTFYLLISFSKFFCSVFYISCWIYAGCKLCWLLRIIFRVNKVLFRCTVSVMYGMCP